ncbi:MAG: bifunctional hydroxymethylpyrimidine kinase/phosphomethylpyrimidine kinase [Planctomycetes bacterium]|nr:bifunctional hydroxymethylpyrimidine kinase/phosphomethylpyrimidine kinase [Planctomycetota bacterium]
MTGSAEIVSAGLSPAWQQILVFDQLRVGEVNRAREAHRSASGKILNVARAVHRLGAQGCAVTVLGGPAGDAMRQSLEAERLRIRALASKTPSRTCTTVVDGSTGAITELVENAGPLALEELAAFQGAFRKEARRASFIVLAGSLTAGAPQTLFRDLVEGLKVPVLADIRGPELLHLLPLKPKVVKPNREELEKTFAESIRTNADLKRAMLRLNELGAEWVVISQGPEVLWACRGPEFHRFQPPRVKALNPIGSGEALAAGLAVGLASGMDFIESIRLGMACAVENAITLLPIDIDKNAVHRRMGEIRHFPE